MTIATRRKVDYADDTFAYVDAPAPGTSGGVGDATPAVTSVAASATVVTLKAANAARRGLSITNSPDASGTLYIKNGAAATLTDWDVYLAPGARYEMEQPINAGIVTGIWASAAAGSAKVKELT